MKNTGTLIDSLKSGQNPSFRHHNPYLEEALLYPNILFTKQEFIKNPNLIQNISSEKNLILEIGCYFGKTVLELASLNPKCAVLGLDITYKRTVKSARKIKKNKLQNASIALCDGLFFCQKILRENSINGVCVFFPDPWLKSRQEKKRLLNKEFVDAIFKTLKPGGFFWLKTDQKEYFLSAHKHLEAVAFITSSHTIPPTLNDGDYKTEFQKLFIQKNIEFYQGVYLKP